MLKFFRKKGIQKKILVVLAAIIIPAFVLWGAGGLREEKIAGYSYVGTIEGKKVPIKDFIKERKRTQIQILLNYMGQKEVLDKLLNNKDIINNLTWDRLLMLNEAKRRGLKISDKEVVAYISQSPVFIHQGVFDQRAYEYFVKKTLGLNPRSFEETIREFLLIDKVKGDIVSNVTVNDKELLQQARKKLETAKLTYFILPVMDKEVDVNNNEIQAFYDNNKQEFIVPEKIDVKYLAFNYGSIEEKNFTKSMAGQMMKKIKEHKNDFSVAFERTSQDPVKTGLVSRKQLRSLFNFDQKQFNKLFNMKKQHLGVFAEEGVSGKVYIMEIVEREKEHLLPLKDARKTITEQILFNKREMLAKAQAAQIYEQLKEGLLDIEQAAQKNNVKVFQTDQISRYDYLEDVGSAYDLLERMLADPKETLAQPIRVNKGYLFARIDDVMPLDAAVFNEEKEGIYKEALSTKQTKALQQWFAEKGKKSQKVIDLKYV